MNALFKRSGNKGVITLEGELTLPYAEKLRGVLLDALAAVDEVSIAFENVQDADLSCLQLLCSAHRSAVRIRKQVLSSGDQPRIFSDVVEAAGFVRSMGCKLDCGNSCLWVEKTEVLHG